MRRGVVFRVSVPDHVPSELPLDWMVFATSGAIAVEMEPESEKELERNIYPLLRQGLPGAWIVYAYAEDRSRAMRSPNIVKPRAAEELLQAAVKGQTRLR